MKVAVIGSRGCGTLTGPQIKERLPEDCSCIISGGAAGVDTCAEECARMYNIPFLKLEPEYQKYGKLATIKRNEEIVRRSDLVLAFWDFQSRGTAHTIAQCIRQQVAVQIIDLKEWA